MSKKTTTDLTGDVITLPTTIYVYRTAGRYGKPENVKPGETEVIEVHKFATEPARAHISIPFKVNHDYHSVGVTVGVTLPCYKEEILEGIADAVALAEDRLRKEMPSLIKTALGIPTLMSETQKQMEKSHGA